MPDPGRDAFAAMEHTVALLLLARPATEVEAVASDVLQSPRHWQFRGGAVGCTVGNVAEAWLRAGDPARAEAAAGGVGPPSRATTVGRSSRPGPTWTS